MELRRRRLEIAKLLSSTECLSDRINSSTEIVSMTEAPLTEAERTLVADSSRAMARSKAQSIRVLRGVYDQQRSRGRADRCQKLDEYINAEVGDFLDFCSKFVASIDQSLIPHAKNDISAMIFYLKTKADFLRYQIEFLADAARAHVAGQAMQCYDEALSTAGSELAAPNSLWLAVALNYSVFLFETQGQSKQAIDIARKVLEDSATLTNSGNEAEFKEATRLQEVIRQNLAGWTHDEAASPTIM
jgi:hypothetical protein